MVGMSAVDAITAGPWVLRLRFNGDLLAAKRVSLSDVASLLHTVVDDTLRIVHTSLVDTMQQVMHVRLRTEAAMSGGKQKPKPKPAARGRRKVKSDVEAAAEADGTVLPTDGDAVGSCAGVEALKELEAIVLHVVRHTRCCASACADVNMCALQDMMLRLRSHHVYHGVACEWFSLCVCVCVCV